MQMTTREAVCDALNCMSHMLYEYDNNHKEYIKTKCAMQLLCEHYGFKLEQFCDVEVAE